MPNMNEVLGVILGGGQGKRLFPLTVQRSKPAVPIGGKYRLIDIPISNCINSNIFKMAVLTQFNSVSLNRHIARTYVFDAFHRGFVQIWAAEQTMEHTDWYQGTADAVRKQINEIQSTGCKYVLILAGDHLYRMNYAKMAEFHWETGADITVAVQPVPKADAPRFGILKRQEDFRITDFAEKPKDPKLLAEMVSRDDPEMPYLGSMGIYLFNVDTLVSILSLNTKDEKMDDFGGDVIPHYIRTGAKVFGYDFTGYWRDIGTIRAFFEANLELTDAEPEFNLFEPNQTIFTHARFLPGTRINNSTLKKVLLAEGCTIDEADIEHSVIGVRSVIRKGSHIKDTVMMGADYYETHSGAPMGIGNNCDIECAIIDKNASIGDNVIIRPFPPDVDLDHYLYAVRDGVVVIPKNKVVPAGTIIRPRD